MSHFTVAVLSHNPEDVETLLEPYSETTDDPAYLEFEEGLETLVEMRSVYEQEKKPDESFEDFVERWYGYTYNAEKDAYGNWCNPDAKWDWWEIGGRWSGMLKLKAGLPKDGDCNQAQIKDIDFTPDKEAYAKAARFWEVVVEESPLREGETPEQFRTFRTREFYLKRYLTKENYARSYSGIAAWAFVTPDGEWYETGQMGWFGMDDSTAESCREFQAKLQQTLAEADPELWLTVVDCHI